MPTEKYPNQKYPLEVEINTNIDYGLSYGIDKNSGHMRTTPNIKDFDAYTEAHHNGLQDIEYRAGLAGRNLPDYVRDLIYNEGVTRTATDTLQGTFYADEEGRNKIFDGIIDELAKRHNTTRENYLATIDDQIKENVGDEYGSQPLESTGLYRHSRQMFGLDPQYIELRDANIENNPQYDFIKHVYVDIQKDDDIIPVRLDVDSQDIKIDPLNGRICIDEEADVTIYPVHETEKTKMISSFTTMYELQHDIEAAEVTKQQRAMSEITPNTYDASLVPQTNSGPWTDPIAEMEM